MIEDEVQEATACKGLASSTSIRCDKACSINMIQCTDCYVWMYKMCTGVSQVQFSVFYNADVPFECPHCLGCHNDGTYNWSLCQYKLNKNHAIAGTTARWAVNFGIYRSLQRLRAVFTAIATLSN